MPRKARVIGRSLLNRLIDKLPVELHLPGYQFCGPGTKLEKRLQLGQKGINPLDEACRRHDLAYSSSKETRKRQEADKILAEEAWSRVISSDANLKEKAAAWAVTNIMKAKSGSGHAGERKMGGRVVASGGKGRRGSGRKRGRCVRGGRLQMSRGRPAGLRKGIAHAKRAINDPQNNNKSIFKKTLAALRAAKEGIIKSRKPYPRVIPIPKKKGGILPFLMAAIPALAALGSVAGGAASLVKTINEGKRASEELAEKIRHNKKMEEISIGKGLYLKPWKGGLGLYIKAKN